MILTACMWMKYMPSIPIYLEFLLNDRAAAWALLLHIYRGYRYLAPGFKIRISFYDSLGCVNSSKTPCIF